MRRWFRMYFRKFLTKPKDLQRAAIISRRLSFVYALLAWNAFGVYLYVRIKESYPMTSTEEKFPVLWHLRLIGETETTVVSIEGLTKKSHVHFDTISDTMTSIESDSIFPPLNIEDETEQMA